MLSSETETKQLTADCSPAQLCSLPAEKRKQYTKLKNQSYDRSSTDFFLQIWKRSDSLYLHKVLLFKTETLSNDYLSCHP